MKKVRIKKEMRFKQSVQGQSLIEYVILSTFIGICCLMALKQLGGVLEKRILHLKKEVVENIPPS